MQHVILFFHGGGYVSGSVAVHKLLCVSLARATGMRILLPEYGLAPENPFPAALEDALSAYHWLLAQGFRSVDIIIAGDSAGWRIGVGTIIGLCVMRAKPRQRWSRLSALGSTGRRAANCTRSK